MTKLETTDRTVQISLQPKNLICNFRAQNLEEYRLWQRFKAWCEDNGNDVCKVALYQVASFMAAVDHAKTSSSAIVTAPGQVINIDQKNTCVHQVVRSRREPFDLSCVKPEFRRTISSIAQEAYIESKARRLNGEFSFHDFRELEYDLFRRIIVRMRRKGLIITYPERSVPQMYLLAENLAKVKRRSSTIQ